MGMTGRGRVRHVAAAAAMLCLGAACSADGPSSSDPAGSPATDAPRQGPAAGSTDQGKVSGADELQLAADAASAAAEQIASGEGLRVENGTGKTVVLVLPDGDTAAVEPGRFVVILRSCRDTLPLRAETEAGALLGKHDGPCRTRDTWILD